MLLREISFQSQFTVSVRSYLKLITETATEYYDYLTGIFDRISNTNFQYF
jgi:hypothetical protein